MGCPCNDKKDNTPEVENVSMSRLGINCPGCGLARLLPTGLDVGDLINLLPCPKCGSGFSGRFVGNGVQQ